MNFSFISIGFTLLVSTTPSLAQETVEQTMSFFVTSIVNNGDLGGLKGADKTCQSLAAKVGAGDKIWKAYLSTHGTRRYPAVNARERIGEGPWYNANGILIASSVADLHGDIQRDSNLITAETALTEYGNVVPGRVRADGKLNEHDMLTGSDSHGRAFPAGASRLNNLTCNNWTDSSDKHIAMVGHHDRASSWNTSWNSSHSSTGCSNVALQKTGGAGRFYCFAQSKR
ncbi:MAG: hypothetical protein V7784_06560 [Oceanospirillaceae bacterium]